ncbi:MAG: DNA-formamidopyrimidine glycosylase family protein, partial [Gemmatimonadota bacterium]
LSTPFLLRSVAPPLAEFVGQELTGVSRIGKRLAFEFPRERFLVLHLMIAGRLRWKKKGAKAPGKIGLATFDFPDGTLLLTEAGTKRRASLHAVEGRAGLEPFIRGGLEPMAATAAEFSARLRLENHTLKRALTDPRLFSGIGNAYSDEILHRAQLSPLKLTSKLSDLETEELRDATVALLGEWTDRLVAETRVAFPEKVTAFRPEFAVHGKYREPCPVCGSPVQRIRYADNETNYCPTCQTDGKLLADRALSRLLKEDWPRSLEELDERLGNA